MKLINERSQNYSCCWANSRRHYVEMNDEIELSPRKPHQPTQMQSRHISWDSGNVSRYSDAPMLAETSVPIQSPLSVKNLYSEGHHAFAFAWFQVAEELKREDASAQSTPNENRDDDGHLSVIEEKSIEDASGLPITSSNENGNDDNHLHVSGQDTSSPTSRLHDGTLPALSVVNKIHQQPYAKHRLFKVELMGYDECFNNLDSRVNRKTLWCDALGVFIQALLLPLFVAIPLRKWIKFFKTKLCHKKFEITPRARPVDGTDPIKFKVHLFTRNYLLFPLYAHIVLIGPQSKRTNPVGHQSVVEEGSK